MREIWETNREKDIEIICDKYTDRNYEKDIRGEHVRKRER